MNKITCFLVFVYLWIIVTGCQIITNKSQLEIGMARSGIINNNNLGPEIKVITGPAEMMKGNYYMLNGKMKILLVFDDKDHLHGITTSDKSFRLTNGLGVNSSLADIKKRYKSYKISISPYYARYVEVKNGIKFGFSWKQSYHEDVIGDHERVAFISFEKLGPDLYQ